MLLLVLLLLLLTGHAQLCMDAWLKTFEEVKMSQSSWHAVAPWSA
jgi:hypothetical protein